MKKNIICCLLMLLGSICDAQSIDYALPKGYEDQITKKEYKKVVDLSVRILSENYQVLDVKDGGILLEVGGDSLVNYLDNLLNQIIHLEKKGDLEIVVEDYYANLLKAIDTNSQNDFTVFESVKDYLSVRIYQKEFVEKNGGIAPILAKEIIENTYAVVMLDLPTAFTPLTREVFEKWKLTEEEVFNTGQENVNQHEVLKKTESMPIDDEKVEIHLIAEELYAASYVLGIQDNWPESIGEYGSIVMIPNNGLVVIYKISKANPSQFMPFIVGNIGLVEEFYQLHPQPVSKDFYWYYKKGFTKVNVEKTDDGRINVIPPFKLNELILK